MAICYNSGNTQNARLKFDKETNLADYFYLKNLL